MTRYSSEAELKRYVIQNELPTYHLGSVELHNRGLPSEQPWVTPCTTPLLV